MKSGPGVLDDSNLFLISALILPGSDSLTSRKLLLASLQESVSSSRRNLYLRLLMATDLSNDTTYLYTSVWI